MMTAAIFVGARPFFLLVITSCQLLQQCHSLPVAVDSANTNTNAKLPTIVDKVPISIDPVTLNKPTPPPPVFDFSRFTDLTGLKLAQTPLNPDLTGLPTASSFAPVNLGQIAPDLTALIANIDVTKLDTSLAALPIISPRRNSNMQDLIELGVGPAFSRSDLFEGDLLLDNDTISQFYGPRLGAAAAGAAGAAAGELSPVAAVANIVDQSAPDSNATSTGGSNTVPGSSSSSSSSSASQTKNNRRTVTTDPSRLWPGRNVYYTFSSSISSVLAQTIRDAMDHWEDNTCLRFFQRTSQSDYISFQTTEDGCYSDSIGRDGGKQIINLGSGCEHFGVVVHEIGHALGKWHEQTRPDRDSFVHINTQNIQDGKGSQFSKRSTDESDPLSVGYDYGSIMHYSRTAFSKNGQNTIDVSNNAAYAAQGSPSLGQRSGLSSRDILQINRLYTCPGSGLRGTLRIYLRYARNLEDRDGLFSGSSDPYVEINAVTATGAKYVQRSSTKDGTENPNFYEWIEFSGNTYQNFRLKIWDSDGGLNGDDDPLSISQTIDISPGMHSYVLHCADLNCHGYMWFDWEFVVDVNECASNPCQNGGVCIDGISRYTCNCPSTYTGTNCQYRQRNLRVYARYGRNLPDEDGIWNDSDPYMEFIATTVFGTTVRRLTAVKDGTSNPTWNQYLDFGVNTFTALQVRIYDSDGFLGGSDDALSGVYSYVLNPGTTTYVKVCATNGCNVGYAYFDYTLA